MPPLKNPEGRHAQTAGYHFVVEKMVVSGVMLETQNV